MQYSAGSLEETQHIAENFARAITKERKGGKSATVVALYGELGSGKTSFVQGAARALGIEETVASPTFIIERIYKPKSGPFSYFIHIDCYRFERAEELQALGWDEMAADPRNIIFIEWAEKVAALLPKHAVKIYFEHAVGEERKIKISDA